MIQHPCLLRSVVLILVLVGLARAQQPADEERAPICPPVPPTTPDPRTFEQRWSGGVLDVFSLDGAEAWTVEDGGRIRHRDADGAWTQQSVPKEVGVALRRVHFLAGGQEGWAVGQEGWVLHTTNGGREWTILSRMPAAQPSQQSVWEHLYDVFFMDSAEGWLLGKQGIWHTIDGGTCWIPARMLDEVGAPADFEADHVELYTLDFFPGVCEHVCGCTGGDCDCPVDPRFGLASGEPGLIWRTIEGDTWRQVFDLRDLCAGEGFQSGCAPIYLSQMCAGQSLFEPWDIEIRRSTTEPVALMVGGTGPFNCGLIFASSDWGCTWVEEIHECDSEDPARPDHCDGNISVDPDAAPQKLEGFVTLYGVGIYDGDGSALAAGYGGGHHVRDPGPAGQLWRDQSSFGNPFLPDRVVFPMQGAEADAGSAGDGKGFIVGMGNVIRRTVDGGSSQASFVHEAGLDDEFRVHDVCFYQDERGWQVGQFHRLAETLDGGKNFQVTAEPDPLLGRPYLHAVAIAGDQLHGVAVGAGHGEHAKPKILFTDDNDTWQSPTSVLFHSRFDTMNMDLWEVEWARDAGFQHFWAVGNNGLILRTVDGGQNWVQFVPEPLPGLSRFQIKSISLVGPDLGFVVGARPDVQGHLRGAIRRYQRASPTEAWESIDALPVQPASIRVLMDVDALDADVVYAVGRKQQGSQRLGLVMRWDPSSETFQEVDIGMPIVPCPTLEIGEREEEPLTEVEVLSSTDVWIAGQCGQVWHFDGGNWTEHKSQTDAHVMGMSFPSAGRGYIATHRDSLTQSCITCMVGGGQ